eukprot:CAMPEP_0171943324 /NCGR_PEP_ID=MMETSP0993-20121228/39409_1 /TAXON_ID=483369 /ORGANISM="non described non described, Strain CCMP2098" /LENGTH=302 /DNA_ID=CAMNT_0012585921 /DNA_START=201 /DNA_END=1106 /DNA_ORIENTATION=-
MSNVLPLSRLLEDAVVGGSSFDLVKRAGVRKPGFAGEEPQPHGKPLCLGLGHGPPVLDGRREKLVDERQEAWDAAVGLKRAGRVGGFADQRVAVVQQVFVRAQRCLAAVEGSDQGHPVDVGRLEQLVDLAAQHRHGHHAHPQNLLLRLHFRSVLCEVRLRVYREGGLELPQVFRLDPGPEQHFQRAAQLEVGGHLFEAAREEQGQQQGGRFHALPAQLKSFLQRGQRAALPPLQARASHGASEVLEHSLAARGAVAALHLVAFPRSRSFPREGGALDGAEDGAATPTARLEFVLIAAAAAAA